jgi:N6-adenosine-specific RNA methylase IME4
MDLEEIKAMDLPADDNCVLFLWVTAPFLADAMHVLKAWGFTYKTGAVWDKERLGMGYWFRIQHEHLLIAVRGDVKTPYPENRVSSVIRAPRGEHSKKPECVYDMIEKMFPGERYLELFARTTRDGWSSWGNEVC